ncbi:MAG: hypothetical protein ING19_18910 [Azospirillum sp.]|nr:hypothetical protein [Azospirillum sp.]
MTARCRLDLIDPETWDPHKCGCGVEYDPSWDYDVASFPAEEKERVLAVLERLRPAAEAFELTRVAVFNAGEDGFPGGCLGVQIRDLSSSARIAIIGVDLAAHRAAEAENPLIDGDGEFAVTIAHELGHAICDVGGLDLAPAEEEILVETFARTVFQDAIAAIEGMKKIAQPVIPRATSFSSFS